jgi:hypothetical protein
MVDQRKYIAKFSNAFYWMPYVVHTSINKQKVANQQHPPTISGFWNRYLQEQADCRNMIPWMPEYRTLSTPINKTCEYTHASSRHGLSSKQSHQFKSKNHSIYKWEWQDYYLSGKLCGGNHKNSREINLLKTHWRQQIRTYSKFLINHCLVLLESMLDSKDTVRKDCLLSIQILPKLSSQGEEHRAEWGRTPKAKQHGCCSEAPNSPLMCWATKVHQGNYHTTQVGLLFTNGLLQFESIMAFKWSWKS